MVSFLQLSHMDKMKLGNKVNNFVGTTFPHFSVVRIRLEVTFCDVIWNGMEFCITRTLSRHWIQQIHKQTTAQVSDLDTFVMVFVNFVIVHVIFIFIEFFYRFKKFKVFLNFFLFALSIECVHTHYWKWYPIPTRAANQKSHRYI